MKRLSEHIVANRGTKYLIVKRDKNKAIYLSEHGVYEVFRIRIAPPAVIMGKTYPKRELFPRDEDFGKTAWCFNTLEAAEKHWDILQKFEDRYWKMNKDAPLIFTEEDEGECMQIDIET